MATADWSGALARVAALVDGATRIDRYADDSSRDPILATRGVASVLAAPLRAGVGPYRRALPFPEAVRRLREASGSQLDSTVVDAMLQAVGAAAGTATPTAREAA